MDDGTTYIAMEFIAGQTLAEVIGTRPMPASVLLKYAIQIADAMAAAHKAGIVHRDLKPGNIMVTEEERVKVLDFGLAKLTEEQGTNPDDATQIAKPVTQGGAILGTASYMSPEQAEGKKADARSDIFSFGTILYEMATGQRAFTGKSVVSTLSAVLNHVPPPVKDVRKEPSRELDRIIRQCLRKEPGRRFQHMDDIRVELEALAEEGEPGADAVEMASPRGRISWMAALLLLPMLIAGVWWLSQGKQSAQSLTGLRRISQSAGLAKDPAISLDGKLVAFSSDHAGQGNLDIWVQQTGGGDAIRITRDAADESEPAFSINLQV